MFGNKIKKLEKALESAAIELTMAESLGPPPDGHLGAKQAIAGAARSAMAGGKDTQVQSLLSAADDHPMSRGSQPDEWRALLAEIRHAL